MGLIGWIKKEIESTSRQRRQSAPPPIHNIQFQDPAYRRAIEKFREYRNSGRFERLNETKNTSTATQLDVTATNNNNNNNNKTIDSVSITDVEIQSYERERLKNRRKHNNNHKHDINKTDAIYSNCNPEEVSRNNRFSLPIIPNTTMQFYGRNKNAKKLQPTSTIDEIEEFEQNHCNKISDESFGNSIETPPSKFYHENSAPYESSANKKSCESAKKQTPRKLIGRNILKKNKGKAPQPPSAKKESKVDTGTESTVNFYNGNFKRYDVSTASVNDELVISSKAYKGRMRKEHSENINSVGESASSGSLSSDTVSDKNLIKSHRLSPLNYQTVINKHGEEVEYALPYNERDSILEIPPLPDAPIPNNNTQHQVSMQFDQLIDQNFKFLNSKIDFLHSQIEMDEDEQKCFQSINQVDIHQRQNIQVTDLDKSNECGLAFPVQTGDIMKDLDALSKWTQNFEKNDRNLSPIEQYQAIQKNVKVFNVSDIKYKPGSIRNSFSSPLEFSNGYFHQTPITLRSTLPNNYSICNFADSGCKREFEILCQVKHLSIVTLMGISFDKDLRVTSLIMEPFDYTLNHYLHQMDKFYNIQQTVSIIHQIASATQYLNECGFIHSNISSHAVLIRENPFAVKLSSFELVTEILPREMTGKFYEMQNINSDVDIYSHDITRDDLAAEKYEKLSKKHFYNRTSLPFSRFEEDIENDDDDEYKLPYSIAYRRMFSMHFYQAPELLISTNNLTAKYVKPTIKSDVYGLALMLWELINRVVPYVIYNHDELICGFAKGNVQLPVLDKSSIIFKEIFESCLHADDKNRLSSVSTFITMLEDLQLLGYEKDKKIEVLEIIEPQHEHHKIEKNIKNLDQRDKLREKIYFSKTEMNDPQKRFENALTTENLIDMGLRDTSQKVSESVLSSEIEANMMSFSHPAPGILQDDALDRIRKTVESQRDITPKKPSRRNSSEEHFEHSKNSTMFQSFFGFDRLQTPKVDKDVIYERTSTLKKRLKAGTSAGNKKSVKGLFDVKPEVFEEKPENVDEKKILRDQFEKMNAELNLITNNYNKSDFMQEIVKEIQDRGKAKNDNGLTAFLNKAVPDNNLSRSFEELPINEKEAEFVGIKRSESDACGSNLHRYSSSESFSLPHTPIARQNMIRRNAWLSENNPRHPSNSNISEDIPKRSIKFSNSSPLNDSKNLKQYNVNIKIHRNDLDACTTPKSTNLNQSQSNTSIKIKLYNSANKLTPIVKVNNVDLNKTSYTEDINKKYYPFMPEMLSDAIQNKRDRSFLQMTQFEDERNKMNHEKSLEIFEPQELLAIKDDESDCEVEEKVIVPLPISVRETVKLIETTYSPNIKVDIPKQHPSINHDDGIKFEKITEETQTDDCQFPSLTKENCVDDGLKCLLQPSESIQKLENIQSNDDEQKNKKLENIVNQSTISTQTPKKITTKVTLNLKKISGRSSDVTHLKHVQEQMLNNPEILKRFQAHFKGSDSLSCKNEQISASCSSLISKDCNEEMVPANGGHNKYFCRNCGFTMIPTEILQKIQNSGRLSIIDNQSVKIDENSQSLAAIRKCQQLAEIRSTEDLYIDDDFCQGITQSLAANMELLPPPDFFDSIDFNILSAEIFHTQEHEFDDTLKDPEEDSEKHNDEEINTSNNELLHVDDDVVPICDEKNKEIKKQDEPKVEANN